MLIADLVKDFYQKLLHDRVLLLVAMDVDALAACKILQALLRSDHIQYTLVPVENQIDVEKAFQDHKEQYKNMVFLNCGGNVDLLEILQPPEDLTLYVVDSHRPVDLINFYCERQVYLLMKHDHDELSVIPDYDDLYKDEDEDESGDGSDDAEQSTKRRRFDEDVLEKRRQRRIWEEKRKEILFDYEEFSYNGTSSALLMYELAWKMSKDSNDTLWWGIIGVTDQFQNKKIGRDKYVSSVIELQGHMSRLNHRHQDEDNSTSINCMKITFEHDLDLALYRHWSLFDSLCHSPLTATVFKVWTSNGMKRLHQFLAEMGIPLSQCKQSYSFMDSKVREDLQTLVEGAGQKFGLSNIRYQSFSAQFGYSHKMCASDVVHSVSAILENENSDKGAADPHNNFVDALDALSKISSKSLETGIALAKEQMCAMKSHVSSFIEIGQVVSYGPFLYTHVKEGGLDVRYFSRPIYLSYFAHHLLHAYLRSLGKSKRDKAKNLPLVVCAPLDAEQGISIVIGVPPLAEESRRNLFGRAFLHSAERTNSNTAHDYFDPCIMTLKSEDRSKFLDALITIMS